MPKTSIHLPRLENSTRWFHAPNARWNRDRSLPTSGALFRFLVKLFDSIPNHTPRSLDLFIQCPSHESTGRSLDDISLHAILDAFLELDTFRFLGSFGKPLGKPVFMLLRRAADPRRSWLRK